MSIQEQVKILCIKLNISLSELARKSGQSPQALSQKLKRGKLSIEELKEIAKAVNCEYETNFILPNGDKVTY